MFNFTTTTLIHSLDLFVANPTNTSAGQTATSAMLFPSHNTLWVNGVNMFRKENVLAIYRTPYVAPLAGRLVVNVSEIASVLNDLLGNTPNTIRIRLKFSLRRTGDNNSYYARDEVFKGKDFVYEWVLNSNTTAESVAKQIKKINRLYGDIYLDVHVGTQADNNVLVNYDGQSTNSSSSNSGSNTSGSNGSIGDDMQPVDPGALVVDEPSLFNSSINGVVEEMDEIDKLVFVNDNYGLFTDATLEYWQDGVSDCCHYVDGGWIPFDQIDCHDNMCVNNCSTTDCDVITRGIKESTHGLLHIVDCVNGTGTYQQILKDLRLPTMENLGYMSLTQQMNEMPIPGMNYVQYTLHYVTCRGILGGSAVGEVTHSKTTHVFFVPATCCNCESANIVDIDSAFLAALKEAFDWEVCGDESRLVAAPHDDPTVAPSFKGQLHKAYRLDTRTNNDTAPQAMTGKEQPISGSSSDNEDDPGTSESIGEMIGGGDTPSAFPIKDALPVKPNDNETDTEPRT